MATRGVSVTTVSGSDEVPRTEQWDGSAAPVFCLVFNILS